MIVVKEGKESEDEKGKEVAREKREHGGLIHLKRTCNFFSLATTKRERERF